MTDSNEVPRFARAEEEPDDPDRASGVVDRERDAGRLGGPGPSLDDPAARSDERRSGTDGADFAPPSFEWRETVVENVPEGVFVLDEMGTIEYVNHAATAPIGWDPSQLEGQAFETLVSAGVFDESIVDWYEESVRELLSSETATETATCETSVHLEAGETREIEVVLSLRPFDEEFRGTVGVVRDVTERTEREATLQRERDRLDEFVDVVSHDLRNPLTVAKARLELARAEHDDEHLAATAGALDRMAELIEDLLRLAREGDLTVDAADVDLAEAIEQCWGTVETAGATLSIESSPSFRADQRRLRQLLENLVRNAVEHGSTSPRSHAREDAVEHGSTSPPSHAREGAVEHGGQDVTVTVGATDDGFYVEDDGPGIPADKRERVFESGYTEQDDGTGFGLAIVREIAVAHGWDVRVTDGRDDGARFEFAGVELTDRATPTGAHHT